MHAEAYSAAEVLHGPVSIVRDGLPGLALAVRDAAEAAVAETADPGRPAGRRRLRHVRRHRPVRGRSPSRLPGIR